MIRLLHVDDNPDHLELVRARLTSMDIEVRIDRAESGSEALLMLEEADYDCVLIDYRMPGMDGLELLGTVRERGQDTPFIFLTGQGSEEVALRALRAGADDYFIKEVGLAHYEQLLSSICGVVESRKRRLWHREVIEALRQSETRYRNLFESSKEAAFLSSFSGSLIDANSSAAAMLGYARAQMTSIADSELYADVAERARLKARIQDEGYVVDHPIRLRRRDGSVFEAAVTASIQRDAEGHVYGYQATLRDVSASRETENELLRRLQMFTDGPVVLFKWQAGPELPVEYASPNVSQFGYRSEDISGTGFGYISIVLEEDRDLVSEQIRESAEAGADTFEQEYRIVDAAGSVRWLNVYTIIKRDAEGEADYYLGYVLDITEHKQFEADLQHVEERQRAYVQQSSEGVWCFEFEEPMPLSLSADEQVEYALEHARLSECNDVLARMYGFTKTEEMKGLRLRDLLDESDPSTADFLRSIALSGHRIVDAESHGKDARGGDKFFLNNVIGVQEDGRLTKLWGTQRDITKQKLAELKLRESEELYRSLISTFPDAVFATDLEGNFTYVSRRTLAVYGYSNPDELTGRSVMLLLDESEHSEAENNFKLTLREGHLRAAQYGFRRKDGSSFIGELSSSLIRDAGGEVKGVISTVRDITERRLAEQTLQRSEEKYKSLTENINVGIYRNTPGPEGRFIEVNPALVSMLRFPGRQELLRARVADIFRSPQDREKLNAKLAEEGFVRNEELELLRSDGSTFIASISAVAVRDDAGRLRFFDGVIEDVTDRSIHESQVKRHHDKLAQRTGELESVNKELEAFSYSVSHDLRTPLYTIESFSQMLLDQKAEGLDDTALNHLQRINAAAQRMDQLINDMLELSRITTGQIKRSGVNLSKLVEGIGAELHKNHQNRKVRLDVAGDIMAEGDERLLRVALENLLGNAWKFTRESEFPSVQFGVTRQRGQKVFFVRDNGTGFDKAKADQLFVPFKRLHPDDKFEGTGIGLSIVQRIINRHGGRIWAESEAGKGATFFFTLDQ